MIEQAVVDIPEEDPRAAAVTGRRRERRQDRTSTRWQRMKREWQMYVFIVPGVLFFLLFAYVPLAGNVVAFQDYSAFRGMFESEWVGLQNFSHLLTDDEVMQCGRRTR